MARWSPRYVLLVGIAGGLERDGLELGDVVISKEITNYEYGKLVGGDFTPRPEQVHQVDGPLLRFALVTTKHWTASLLARPDGSGKSPKLRLGMVGSGEKVVDDRSSTFFRSVERAFPKLLALEMEGAGAIASIEEAQSAGKQVGFLMIRGISDMPPTEHERTSSTAGGGAQTGQRDRWKEYACAAAASFAVQLIADGLPVPPKGRADALPGLTSRHRRWVFG